jgi:hypothetical protein
MSRFRFRFLTSYGSDSGSGSISQKVKVPVPVPQRCFQIFKTEIKYQKPIAVDVLFKAYPMVLLSCRSNMAGRYL